jgi:GTP-binding protein
MFVDEIKVTARAGRGGRGCVSFCREAYRPKGGPDGGNGGRGGDVILEGDHDLNNLVAQFYQPRLEAQDGEHGLGKGMDGHAGRDLVVKVPCGTIVWRLPTAPEPTDDEQDDEDAGPQPTFQTSSSQRPLIATRAPETTAPAQAGEPGREFVADITGHGQRLVLCKGGRGGLGNRNFATATRQAPRFAQPGEPGARGEFLLELRIIADVGLVGFPNAGKSTLLTAISKARPKVAPYPFTTLTPQVGIVEYPDYRRLTVCDVPGLIEGAHRNVGLGHAFLRHVRRCKVLVILLDMAATDGHAPWDDYRQLLAELKLYDPAMIERPRLVVANKMDEPAAEKNLREFKKKVRRVKVLPISAAFDEGIGAFRQSIHEAAKEDEGAK